MTPPAAAHFGAAFAGLSWRPVGGGFSGSRVFAGSDPSSGKPELCLKAYPPDSVIPDRLAQVHAWMARAADLPFVPKLRPAPDGGTWVEAGGRLWELTDWMPGVADFRDRPTDARLANACAAVAALHRAWQPNAPVLLPFPAVARRLALRQAVARAAAVLPRWIGWAERALAPWVGRPVPVRPCLCDVHHDHVLFTGDAVTGVIDYAAMKPDHPAVDLARLLGDLVPDDPARLAAGLAAYHAAGGPADVTAELVELLDRTGTVCAVANWLLRLSAGPPAGPAAVAARLDRLVRRLESGFVRP